MNIKNESRYSTERIRRSLLHFLTGKVVSGGLALASLILIIRGLPSDQFGVYTAFFAGQLILINLSSLGIESTTERFIPELSIKAGSTELFSLIILGVLIRASSLIFFIGLLWVFGEQVVDLVGLSAWHASFIDYLKVMFLAGIWQMISTVLEALMQQKAAQFSLVLNSLIRLLVVAYFFNEAGLNLTRVIQAETAGIVFGLSVALSALYIELAGQKKWSFSVPAVPIELFRRLRRFAFFGYSAQILMQGFGTDVLKLIVVRLSGVLEGARYGFSTSLMDIVSRYLPAVLLVRLIRPIFISRYAINKDFGQINIFSSIILKLNLLLLVPLISFVALTGDQVATLVSGGRYADTGPLLFLTLLMLIPMSHQWVISLVANTLEVNELQFFGSIVALLGVPVVYFLVLKYGATGAPLGSYIYSALYNIFAVSYLRFKGYKYKQDISGLIKIIAAGFVAYYLTLIFQDKFEGGLGLIISGLQVGFYFIILCVILKPLGREERAVLSNIFPRWMVVI